MAERGASGIYRGSRHFVEAQRLKLTREFLGWDKPFLASLAKRLIENWRSETVADLRAVTVVLPGSRAARRLEELMAREAAETGLTLFPPAFITPGSLPELLYARELDIAPPVVELLAWQHAVSTVEPSELRSLTQLSSGSVLQWKESLELAQVLASLWREVSAANVSFKDVQNLASEKASEGESERWSVIQKIFELYLKRLEHLEFLDAGSARSGASDFLEAGHAHIVLAALVDIAKSHKALLSSSSINVTSYVFAPEDQQARFDEFGCLLLDEWVGVPFDSTNVNLRVVEDTSLLGGAVRGSISEAGREIARSDVTIGVTDDEIIPFLRQQLEAAGVDAHPGAGSALVNSELGELIRALAMFVSSRTYQALATFVRVPLVADYFQRVVSVESACSVLDDYYQRRLPVAVDEGMSRAAGLKPILQGVKSLCGDFANGEKRDVGIWSDNFVRFLERLLSGVSEEVFSSQLKDGLNLLLEIAAEIEDSATDSIQLSASDYLSLLLVRARDILLPEPQVSDAVELLSWLELALDEAPITIVAGLNEPLLPRASQSDPFLPDSFRELLGLACFKSRWARDAYLFQSMIASKQRLSAIALRRNTEGDALSLSRLLLGMDGKSQAARLNNFYSSTTSGDRRLFLCLGVKCAALSSP